MCICLFEIKLLKWMLGRIQKWQTLIFNFWESFRIFKMHLILTRDYGHWFASIVSNQSKTNYFEFFNRTYKSYNIIMFNYLCLQQIVHPHGKYSSKNRDFGRPCSALSNAFPISRKHRYCRAISSFACLCIYCKLPGLLDIALLNRVGGFHMAK